MARPNYHERKWPLMPLRMRHAEDGGFQHRGMRHDRILHVDRGDPFPTTLDHILNSICELDVAELIDGACIATAPEAIVRETIPRVRHPMVLSGDPGSPNTDLADAEPAMRQVNPN